MTLNRVWIPSPCWHDRADSGVRIIVLHTAEGARTIEDLGHFFQNYNNQVSSHTGADDKLGKIGEYVKRGNASWTAANYNNAAVQIELCGFASWSTTTWKNDHHNMLKNCADWIAEEAKEFGIPITKLTAGQAQGNGRGVCQHRDLGAGGGGHSDCGNGFPMDYVLDLARGKGEAKPGKADQQMFYLQFNEDNTRASVIWPSEYGDGKHRLGLGCPQESRVEVKFYSGGQQTSVRTRTLNNQNMQENVDIPEGSWYAVVNRLSGTEPISCCWTD